MFNGKHGVYNHLKQNYIYVSYILAYKSYIFYLFFFAELVLFVITTSISR